MEPPRVLHNVKLLADGLSFPEGPVARPDGSVLVVEIHAGVVRRVGPKSGRTEVVADCGGGPNGAAVGPDGALYVCNNGGAWPDYTGGAIQRVDLVSGRVDDVYREANGVPLSAPNDIVFERTGNFWFTDFGKRKGRQRDEGRVLYAAPDGSMIAEVLTSLDAPNGIGLSPDDSTLYFSETFTGRLHRRSIVGPGDLEPVDAFDPRAVVCGLPGLQMFDSLAVDSTGAVAVATLGAGCITAISPTSGAVAQRWLPDEFEDSMPTNLCFSLDGQGLAYVTLSTTGRLVSCQWPVPGHPLAF
jgi:gluconolactonase